MCMLSVAGDWLAWELKWTTEAWGGRHIVWPWKGLFWIMSSWMRLSVTSKDYWAVGHHNTATRASEEKQRRERKESGHQPDGSCSLIWPQHTIFDLKMTLCRATTVCLLFSLMGVVVPSDGCCCTFPVNRSPVTSSTFLVSSCPSILYLTTDPWRWGYYTVSELTHWNTNLIRKKWFQDRFIT